MKRIFKTFAVALMAVGMIALTGCKKDEDKNNDRTPIIASLANTNWTGSATLTIPMGESSMPVTISSNLIFSDAQNARITASVAIPGFTIPEMNVTYTWNGDNQGTLHFKDGDVTMGATDVNNLTVNMTAVVASDFGEQAAAIFQMLGGSIPFHYTRVVEN